MVKWLVELSKYGIFFEKKGSIKGQVLTEFLDELTQPTVDVSSSLWILSVVREVNKASNRVGIMLEGHNRVIVEQSLKINFNPTHN